MSCPPIFPKMNSKHIVILLLGIMALLMLSGLSSMSLTYDESHHLNYGRKILYFDPRRVELYDDSKMPFSAFNALAYISVKKILDITGGSLNKDTQNRIAIAAGRLVTIVFALLLGVYVFKWSKEMYGMNAGIFSLFLYVFSPNIIAHSRLITTDLYAALMITMSLFYFWRFISLGGRDRAVVSAAVLGSSQLAKYTCVYLYPIFLAIVLIKYSNPIFRLAIAKNIRELRTYLKVFIKYIVLFLTINIVIINAGFISNRSLTKLNDYEFQSDLFKSIQSVPILKRIPIPVPYPYVQGLDLVKSHEDAGTTYPSIYLLGKLKKIHDNNSKGFKGYYFYAFLFKEPIATQLIIFLSLLAYLLNLKKSDFLKNELFILLPISFFTIYFNFFFNAQVGVRFFLAALPLLYIFCGRLFEEYGQFNVKAKTAFVILLIYLAVSTLSYSPHYLSYFNEFVWDRKQAYKLLADSNIDWGQNEWYLKEYKRKNPEIKVNPEFPTAGRIVVSVNNLVGIFDPEKYKWLRENFEPADSIAYSYLVYTVRPADLRKVLRNK